jgi:hypothetical protein
MEAALLAEARNVQSAPQLESQSLLQSQNAAVFEDYYPYVIHKDVTTVTNIFYPLSGNFVVAGFLSYVNGVQRFPNNSAGVIATHPLIGPSQYNYDLYSSVMFSTPAYVRPFPTGINTTQVINVSQLLERRYGVFAGLRVPRVVISILPDEQLPG